MPVCSGTATSASQGIIFYGVYEIRVSDGRC